jgi:transposase-like protein
MTVIPDFQATTLLAFIKENIAPGSTIYTDGLKQFTGLEEAAYQHVPRMQPLRAGSPQGGQAGCAVAVFKRNVPRPKLNNRDRSFWIGLYMIWRDGNPR